MKTDDEILKVVMTSESFKNALEMERQAERKRILELIDGLKDKTISITLGKNAPDELADFAIKVWDLVIEALKKEVEKK